MQLSVKIDHFRDALNLDVPSNMHHAGSYMPIHLLEPLASSVDCPRTQSPSAQASSRKSLGRSLGTTLAWTSLAPEIVCMKLH